LSIAGMDSKTSCSCGSSLVQQQEETPREPDESPTSMMARSTGQSRRELLYFSLVTLFKGNGGYLCAAEIDVNAEPAVVKFVSSQIMVLVVENALESSTTASWSGKPGIPCGTHRNLAGRHHTPVWHGP